MTAYFMSPRWFALLPLLVCFLAGCSGLDLGVGSNEPPWGERYVDTRSDPDEVRTDRLAKVLAAWRDRGEPRPDSYSAGVGDVLEISVFALEQPNTITTFNRTVASTGSISLPWVGAISVVGLPTQSVEERICAAYRQKGYLRDPQVMVNVLEYNSSTVVVTGAVQKPGVYPLPSRRSTVLESLSLAGGLSREAGDVALVIRGGADPGGGASEGSSAEARGEAGGPSRDAIEIDLEELLGRGNLLLNLELGDGDILSVPRRPERYVSVLGYVRRAGAYQIREGSRMDALQALAYAGGLTMVGRAGECQLVRQTPSGPRTTPVNLRKVAEGKLPPLYLEPGDALIVGTNLWGRISEFFRPTMGATVSASANVAP